MNQDEVFARADALHDQEKFEEAFELFLSLANSGYTSGMTRVALMYYKGEGIDRSLEQSIFWDMRAAEVDDQTALFNLGMTYRDIGDAMNAKIWFEQGSRLGHGDAAFELAKLYMKPECDVDRAREYLKLAAESTNIFDNTKCEARRMLRKLGPKPSSDVGKTKGRSALRPHRPR